MHGRRAWCALAVSAALSACGWKSDGLTRLEELYPTPAPVDAGTQGPLDLGTPHCSGYSGTWAMQLVENGTISPLGPPAWKIQVTDLFLASSDGSSVTMNFCDQAVSITQPSGSPGLGQTRVPDALKAALHAAPVTFTLPADGTFAATDLVWLWGLRDLAQPLTDPLPTHDTYSTDPHVWDQDGDGNPGVRLSILSPAGERDMVRRAIWTMKPGRPTLDNQWLTGVLDWNISESGLEATNSLLLTPAPITPVATGTVYQLRCVGPTYTCASLSADHAAVFHDAPAPAP